MAKYPLSHNAGKNLGQYFMDIMFHHLHPSKNKNILDPTCGKKHLWANFTVPDSDNKIPLDRYENVVFSDIAELGQDLVSNVIDLDFDYLFNGIIYDPPYFFGYKGSTDPRKNDYGDYLQTYDDLLQFMHIANNHLYNMLEDNGKLIVKCADQYHTKERKFYPHHVKWINTLNNFRLVDQLIHIHHRMSPTSFQVKERPCSVIMHTYFLIFQK